MKAVKTEPGSRLKSPCDHVIEMIHKPETAAAKAKVRRRQRVKSGRIRNACQTDIHLWIYLLGYSGFVPPRWLRRLMAGSNAHRAWLCGFTGCFEQGAVRHGPANPYPGRGSQEKPEP